MTAEWTMVAYFHRSLNVFCLTSLTVQSVTSRTAVTVCHQDRHCLSLSVITGSCSRLPHSQLTVTDCSQVLGMSSVSRIQIYVFPGLNNPPHMACVNGVLWKLRRIHANIVFLFPTENSKFTAKEPHKIRQNTAPFICKWYAPGFMWS